jgi:hypothetical protein
MKIGHTEYGQRIIPDLVNPQQLNTHAAINGIRMKLTEHPTIKTTLII